MGEEGALVDLEHGTHRSIDDPDCRSADKNAVNQEDQSYEERIRCSSNPLSNSGNDTMRNQDALVFGHERSKSVDQSGIWGSASPSSEKSKKQQPKRPPRPPRPPNRSLSLDVVDQKLVKDLSDLAKLKRARSERLKALKRKRNAKSSPFAGSLLALVVTVFFCLLIIWQGVRGKA